MLLFGRFRDRGLRDADYPHSVIILSSPSFQALAPTPTLSHTHSDPTPHPPAHPPTFHQIESDYHYAACVVKICKCLFRISLHRDSSTHIMGFSGRPDLSPALKGNLVIFPLLSNQHYGSLIRRHQIPSNKIRPYNYLPPVLLAGERILPPRGRYSICWLGFGVSKPLDWMCSLGGVINY